MNKECVGCGKTIPLAARSCFFCGQKQPPSATANPRPASPSKVSAVVGPQGPKKVTESSASQTANTLMGLDDEAMKRLREEVTRKLEAQNAAKDAAKRIETPQGVPVLSPSAGKGSAVPPGLARKMTPVPSSQATPQPETPHTATAKLWVVPAERPADAASVTASPETASVTAAPSPASSSESTAAPPAAITPDEIALPLETGEIAAAAPSPEPAAAVPAVESAPATPPEIESAAAPATADAAPATSSRTADTQAMVTIDPGAPPAGWPPPVDEPDEDTADIAAEYEEADAEMRRAQRPPLGWTAIGRVVMSLGGVVLLFLFLRAEPLLVSFTGATLALHVLYLVGGLLLLGASALPLPSRVRGVLATMLGGGAVFLAAPSVSELAGWRGIAAALVFAALPGALLLRARRTGAMLGRTLVGLAIAVVVLLYLVPADGVVPIAAALGLLGSGTLIGIMTSAMFLVPLVLALLALTALPGRESSSLGVLWAAVILVAAPASLMLTGVVAGDASLLHLGAGLLAAGGVAALGLSEALSPETA